MNKVLAGSVLVAVAAAGLYSKGWLPFAKPEAGYAASRETTPAAAKTGRNEEPAPAVTVVRAAKITLTETVLISGTLVPRTEVLVAPEVEGLRVMELLVEEGDRVTLGQPLARLEQATLQAQLAQSDAGLAKAAAAIAQARSNIVAAEARRVETNNALERAKPLSKTGTLSESTLDQRESAARTAAAQLQVAQDGLVLSEAERTQVEAQRKDILWRLSRTEVRAPVAGIVSRRNARIGALASGAAVAQSMFYIIADAQVELEGEVPEADLARLKPGQSVVVNVAGVVETKGTIRLVMPEVDKATRQGRVRIGLGDSATLHIGSFGRGVVTLRTGSGLALPASAVLFNAEGAYVQLVSGNRIVSRKVVAGLLMGETVEIKDGLSEGEVVVAKSGTFLRAGDMVTPIEIRESVKKPN